MYIETYGCQMNVNDSEVILSILQDNGYALTESMDEADLILANTCSIRDNAEQRVWGRIDQFRLQKQRRPGVWRKDSRTSFWTGISWILWPVRILTGHFRN